MESQVIQTHVDINDVYTIDKEIGEGSFGIVKKGISKKDNSQVAIKIINKTKMSEEDMVALENEVDILMKADHPNIVKLYSIFEDDKNFYMVLEYMTGGELFERIVAKDRYTEQEAASTMLQIIDALDYCHSFGVVHRDLKVIFEDNSA